MTSSARYIPVNLHAERAVLGACLSSDKALSKVVALLQAPDFYSEVHRTLFGAIKAAAREHVKVDGVLVAGYLSDKRHKSLLFEVVSSLPNAANAVRYAADVKTAAQARRAMDIADRITERCCSGVAEEYEGAARRGLKELEELVRTGSGKLESIEDAQIASDLDDLANWLEECQKNEGITGIRTGIAKLDKALKGLHPARMYIFAGRPGSGKSLLSGQIGLSVARQGKRVLMSSTEMTREQYIRRLACASAGIDAERVEDGNFTNEERRKIFNEAASMNRLPFYIRDHGTQTVDDVRADVMRYEPDLLIVDYLQRLMPMDRRASRYEQVSQISFDLDRIKKDFSIPVIAAAQLSRAVDSRNDKRPVMSDLRDSGTIEQDADAIGMLYRPSHYHDNEDESLIHFELEKNRHGSLFACDLYTDDAKWISDKRSFSARSFMDDHAAQRSYARER